MGYMTQGDLVTGSRGPKKVRVGRKGKKGRKARRATQPKITMANMQHKAMMAGRRA